MSNQPPADYIVYKEHDGLSTFYARHKRDLPKPNYPVPAIPTAHFINDLCLIHIWPGVLQVRISDEYLHGDYTGFGAVITFEHGVSCETRYDDFD